MALWENRIKYYRSKANCTLRGVLVGNATLHVIELLEICGSHRQVYIVTLDLYTATEQENEARGYIYCAILCLQFKHERHARIIASVISSIMIYKL
jgi:hypothetical protein